MKMYEKGRQVTSMADLERSFSLDHAYHGFIWRNKWYHSSWIYSWQFRFLVVQIQQGNLYFAKITPYGMTTKRKQILKAMQRMAKES